MEQFCRGEKERMRRIYSSSQSVGNSSSTSSPRPISVPQDGGAKAKTKLASFVINNSWRTAANGNPNADQTSARESLRFKLNFLTFALIEV